ncbi:ribosome small subunit-dependent GTPase A [Metabacillus herbersteinensis]|uniref:Small ribosomal subunit biogenesis GTPase RsgA n=1 Tax=Metabacillus herbersteinensis TaxID=283816 RepID=A0ABV6GE96_9BACI
MNLSLTKLGWNSHFEQFGQQYKDFQFGRISLEHKHLYRVLTEHGEVLANLSGKFRFSVQTEADHPSVGDWVVLSIREDEQKGTIHNCLPRFSKLSRKSAGNSGTEQLIATNIDTLFIVNALNQDFNLRRMERYLVMAWESGATPVLLLTKSDLCEDIEKKVRKVESVALGVSVHVISSIMKTGLDTLDPYLIEGKSVAIVGSSGVGKSTLVNSLLGVEKQKTQDSRSDDDRGRHTTTYRELISIPKGGILIDTPGMRELQLWGTEHALEQSFSDIEMLANNCYYRDCNHNTEPKCAIKAAIESGALASERFASFKKLQRELAFYERKEKRKAGKK